MQNDSYVIAEGLKIASSQEYVRFRVWKKDLERSESTYTLLSVGVGHFYQEFLTDVK